MELDSFITTAWADHAEHAPAVADRLGASLHLITAPAHIAPYAGIVTHLFGEHLGRWDDGITLLGAMRQLPAYDASEAAEAPLRRGGAVLRCTAAALAGDGAGPIEPPPAMAADERAAVLALTTSALAGRQAFGLAIRSYTEALAIAADGLPAASPALRALAIGGNNLASALESHAGRSAAETEGMLIAAAAALTYWKLAGTWLEEERAEYRLSRSRLAADLAEGAIASAERCVAICEAHDAPALEQFFGHAALALAQAAAGRLADALASRAHAEALHAQIPADDQVWCADMLDQLRASPPAS